MYIYNNRLYNAQFSSLKCVYIFVADPVYIHMHTYIHTAHRVQIIPHKLVTP